MRAYLHDPHAWEGPSAAGWEDLVVCPAHPLNNLSACKRVRSTAQFIVANIVGDSVRFGQKSAITTLESWNLKQINLGTSSKFVEGMK